MKRFFNLLVLTQPEQRLVIVLVLLMVAGAWYQHHRNASDSITPQPTPTASPYVNE
ncbi:MAG TPA: hypothetical protein VIM09_05150 [Chthoniobacterales bacterium]